MTIALVEEVWHGHHPTYFKTFCQLARELGHDVLAICPFPEEVAAAGSGRPQPGGRLYVEKFDPPRLKVRPRRFQGPIDAYLSKRSLRRELRDWEKTHGQKIALVFFACIDDAAFQYFPRTARGFPWPWSGLYLHCRSFRMPGTAHPYTKTMPRPERIFRHPNLHSLAILDEGAVEYMGGLARGRPITVFPDFTDETPPESGGIAEELRRFAAGRPIVGLLGHLHPTKGVGTLARVALDPANRDLVFAFVGELMEGPFPPEDRELFQRLKTAPNVFAHFESVPDDAAFNGVAQACDVLFAAYHDFPHSSNILTKAALLQKPVVVSDGYLMAERARRYALGEIVPQKDPGRAASALRRILANRPRWLEEHPPQWEAFAAAHSRAAARSAFERLLAAKGPYSTG